MVCYKVRASTERGKRQVVLGVSRRHGRASLSYEIQKPWIMMRTIEY